MASHAVDDTEGARIVPPSGTRKLALGARRWPVRLPEREVRLLRAFVLTLCSGSRPTSARKVKNCWAQLPLGTAWVGAECTAHTGIPTSRPRCLRPARYIIMLPIGNGMGRVANRGLRSPVWWASLIILVLNDHVLKGSRVPGIVTGKLSDLAGLVVAPVLVCALVRARSPVVRALCFAIVILPFSAIKVVPAATQAVAAGLSAVGIPSRLWTDWSDLIALVVLPIAWRLASPSDTEVVRHDWQVLERVGVIIGSAACLATSPHGETLRGSLFLVNASPKPIAVAISRPNLPLDCESIEASPEQSLLPEQFILDRCLSLAPASPAVLDRVSPDSATDEPLPPTEPSGCDAVLLSAPGLGDVMIFWRNEPKVEFDAVAYSIDELHPNALYVEPFGDRLVIAETPLATVRVVDESGRGTECD